MITLQRQPALTLKTPTGGIGNWSTRLNPAEGMHKGELMGPRALIGLTVGLWACTEAANPQPSPDPRVPSHVQPVAESRPQTRTAEVSHEDRSLIRFHPVDVCDRFVGGYQVAVADMNGDRRLDILALGEHPGTVDWFENPGKEPAAWRRHAISGTLTRRNIDLAANDVDGDGLLEVAVASDFDLGNTTLGTVSLFHRQTAGAAEWTAMPIHAEPAAHRVRWADVDADGSKELITVPIVGRGARLPGLQEAPARLICHWTPKDPFNNPWPEQIVDQSLTVVHGIFVTDWDNDGRDELLTASNQGIHLLKAEGIRPGIHWSLRQLATGHAGDPPNRGSSEVCVGRGRNGVRFLAAIEPWHGNEVAVYTQPPGNSDKPALWDRKVIDDSLHAGHSLCCADFDGDGCDEIVAGYRGAGTSLYGYRLISGRSNRWDRFVIDNGGIAAQCCVAADVNNDGQIDLVAAGGSTHNVKLYVNETRGRPSHDDLRP